MSIKQIGAIMRKNNTHSRRVIKGVTLIELLVGLAVGLIVLSGLIYGWSIFTRQSDYLLKTAQFNQDLRATMQVITQDLRRAVGPVSGSNPSAVEIVCLNSSSGCTPLVADTPVGDCVVFNANIAEAEDTAEIIPTTPAGFRMRNGRLETWYSAGPTPVSSIGQCPSPVAPAVQPEWQPLLETGTASIESLRFTVSTANSRCLDLLNTPGAEETAGRCPTGSTEKVELLQLDVTLSGTARIGGGAAINFSLTDAVKIRNDSVFDTP